MVHVAQEMEREGFDCPTAHRRRHDEPRPHRGENRAALSRSSTVHVLDASRAVGVVNKLSESEAGQIF